MALSKGIAVSDRIADEESPEMWGSADLKRGVADLKRGIVDLERSTVDQKKDIAHEASRKAK